MNKIKSLAGQTALYGISSILGRILHYLLVPIHTAIFFSDEFGIITQLYSYAAILNILYTYGLETAFFRFASKKEDYDYFSLLFTYLVSSGIIISVLIIFFSSEIAVFLGYPDKSYIIIWLAFILLIDAISALPFAKLRLENRVLKFVTVRVLSILIIIIFNVIFLIIFRDIYQGKYLSGLVGLINKVYDPEISVGYVFLANLVGTSTLIILLWKEFSRIKLHFHWNKFKPVIVYALPVLVTGLAGMFNENLDKILIPEILPDNFYQSHSPIEALGIYGASFKLGVFMMLAVQAFRFAGEPFFFSNAENKRAPKLFADVMHYFVVACSVILVAVSFNVDLIALIFLQKKVYWEALYLVPIFLCAKLFYGIFINLSAWYKIKDVTIYGVWFTLLGTFVTIVGNIVLIPKIGYDGSAITTLLCYFSMCVASYYFGKNYFPVPYRIISLFSYVFIALVLSLLSFKISLENIYADYSLNIIATIIFIVVVYLLEKRNLEKISQ